MAGPRLLVALDYGTTNSGVALTTAGDYTLNWPDDVRSVDSWPDLNGPANQQKVPSMISYAPSSEGRTQFGYDIETPCEVIVNTKLEFTPKSRGDEMHELRRVFPKLVGEQGTGSAGAYAKSDVEIARDYLRKLADQVRNYILDLGEEWAVGDGEAILADVPMDLIITHPAMWDEENKTKTFRAVRAAFATNRFPGLRNVSFVSEPEACALYTLKCAQDEGRDNLMRDDVVVVVDAGGGTVDLASFQVKETEPTFRLRRIGNVRGAECGAIFVDDYFLRVWLRQRLSAREYRSVLGMDTVERINGAILGGRRIITPNEQELLRNFEKIKRQYGNITLEQLGLSLPGGRIHDPRRGIVNSNITITLDDLAPMFEFSINKTLELVNHQVVEANDIFNYRVTSIYVSGGFGRNPMLRRRIRQYGTERGIHVYPADDDDLNTDTTWNAVAMGAILKGAGFGTDPPAVVPPCPKSYGFVVAEDFVDFRHQGSPSYLDTFDGRRKADGQMKWLVAKDSPIMDAGITASIRLTRRFYREAPRNFRIRAAWCNLDRQPARVSEIRSPTGGMEDIHYTLGGIEDTLGLEAQRIPLGQEFFIVELEVTMVVTTSVEVTVTAMNAERPPRKVGGGTLPL